VNKTQHFVEGVGWRSPLPVPKDPLVCQFFLCTKKPVFQVAHTGHPITVYFNRRCSTHFHRNFFSENMLSNAFFERFLNLFHRKMNNHKQLQKYTNDCIYVVAFWESICKRRRDVGHIVQCSPHLS
jgi:hypothetical protein